jgi:galactokinase
MTRTAATRSIRPLAQLASRDFVERYGESPTTLVRAPGRVNLIGEHTDYNDGFVLPLAIEREVWIALRPRMDRRVTVSSADFDENAVFGLEDFLHGGPAWGEYVKGTAWSLTAADHRLQGWDGTVRSDVPIGAGLSSSAALELAAARAFATTSGFDWSPAAMARIAQRAENEWVGMRCGIMDQMIAAVGREEHAVLIDCRALTTRPVPFPDRTVVVVMDTATRRGLVESAYNERRRQCEDAAAFFGVRALRDVSLDMLQREATALDPTTARRARHVVTENARTLAAADAMCHGDASLIGTLMNDSHRSLRDEFEVSSPALDAMVEVAQAQEGCYGARMTGGGFGGCAVALIDRAGVDSFVERVTEGYEQRTRTTPRLYVTGATAGANAFAADPDAPTTAPFERQWRSL